MNGFRVRMRIIENWSVLCFVPIVCSCLFATCQTWCSCACTNTSPFTVFCLHPGVNARLHCLLENVEVCTYALNKINKYTKIVKVILAVGNYLNGTVPRGWAYYECFCLLAPWSYSIVCARFWVHWLQSRCLPIWQTPKLQITTAPCSTTSSVLYLKSTMSLSHPQRSSQTWEYVWRSCPSPFFDILDNLCRSISMSLRPILISIIVLI